MPRPKAIARAVALSVGWLCAVLGLYASLLGLELYWNLFDWLPRWDWQSALLLLGVLVTLIGVWFLLRAAPDKLSRAVSLLLCLGLAAVALYVLPHERLTQGLFARSSPSPLWYRGGRVMVMWLPAVLWLWKRPSKVR